MLHALFITTDQYPRNGPCANIVKNICTSKLAENIDIHILSVKNAYKDADLDTNDGITIHRFYEPEYIALGNFIKRNKKSLFFDLLFYINKFQKKVLSNRSSSIFLEKDSANTVIKSLKKMNLDLEYFDVIIPISGVLDTINIALALNILRNHNCKLIILQVDPCVSNAEYPQSTLYQREDFEEIMLQEADIVLALPSIYKEYQSKLIDTTVKSKIRKIELPNITPDITAALDKINLDGISCVFAGAFYKNIRNPKYMFDLFSKLSSGLKLFLVGSNKLSKEFNLPSNIIPLGRKSLSETKAILNGSDFLINLGNSVSNQVPSKIFDYISFGKPIIHIRKLENDPSMEYLNKYPLCLDLFEGDSIETNVAKLEDFISKNKGKRVDEDYIATTYKECTPEYCAEQLYQAILEVTHSGTQEEREAIE